MQEPKNEMIFHWKERSRRYV